MQLIPVHSVTILMKHHPELLFIVQDEKAKIKPLFLAAGDIGLWVFSWHSRKAGDKVPDSNSLPLGLRPLTKESCCCLVGSVGASCWGEREGGLPPAGAILEGKQCQGHFPLKTSRGEFCRDLQDQRRWKVVASSSKATVGTMNTSSPTSPAQLQPPRWLVLRREEAHLR